MVSASVFWPRYLRLQRATVALLAVVELSTWGYGKAFSWKPLFWDPPLIIEYTQCYWPPLILTGAYLIVVWIIGVAGQRLHVPAVLAWLVCAIPASALAACMVWAMYESTT